MLDLVFGCLQDQGLEHLVQVVLHPLSHNSSTVFCLISQLRGPIPHHGSDEGWTGVGREQLFPFSSYQLQSLWFQ